MIRLLIVNSGLLGARTFGTHLLPRVAQRARGLAIEQMLLTGELSIGERALRRIVCQRVWTDRWPSLANLDLARYRAEWHSGVLARRRLDRVSRETYDALLFYRQPAAYASLRLMRDVPSIVAIDCTQACIRDTMTGALARATLRPGITRDGLVFDAAALIMSNSQWAADSLREMYPQCQTPVEVLRPPVDVEAFDDAWIAERSARAIAGQRPRVLFMGGDFRRKGGFLLLRAWREGNLGEHAGLDLVTNWPLTQRDLPEGVVVHRDVAPYSERWRALWRQADVFAMPARHEAFGNVFQEAAAAGLPRIGLCENAAPENVHDGTDGLLLPSDDARELIRALDLLLGNPEMRRSMGAASRALAVRTMTIDRYASGLSDVVARAITRHRSRALAA